MKDCSQSVVSKDYIRYVEKKVACLLVFEYKYCDVAGSKIKKIWQDQIYSFVFLFFRY